MFNSSRGLRDGDYQKPLASSSQNPYYYKKNIFYFTSRKSKLSYKKYLKNCILRMHI